MLGKWAGERNSAAGIFNCESARVIRYYGLKSKTKMAEDAFNIEGRAIFDKHVAKTY